MLEGLGVLFHLKFTVTVGQPKAFQDVLDLEKPNT